jgi:hypothetical protein
MFSGLLSPPVLRYKIHSTKTLSLLPSGIRKTPLRWSYVWREERKVRIQSCYDLPSTKIPTAYICVTKSKVSRRRSNCQFNVSKKAKWLFLMCAKDTREIPRITLCFSKKTLAADPCLHLFSRLFSIESTRQRLKTLFLHHLLPLCAQIKRSPTLPYVRRRHQKKNITTHDRVAEGNIEK